MDMPISRENTDIIHYLLKIITRYEKFMKSARNYGTDVPIHYSEIHMVSAIAKNPGIHISGLAEHFGYTRGAVSEVVAKLEKKGLLVKEVDPENLSRLKLYLTKKGEGAQGEHDRYHGMVSNLILDILRGLPPEHVEAISIFLRELSEELSSIF